MPWCSTEIRADLSWRGEREEEGALAHERLVVVVVLLLLLLLLMMLTYSWCSFC